MAGLGTGAGPSVTVTFRQTDVGASDGIKELIAAARSNTTTNGLTPSIERILMRCVDWSTKIVGEGMERSEGEERTIEILQIRISMLLHESDAELSKRLIEGTLVKMECAVAKSLLWRIQSGDRTPFTFPDKESICQVVAMGCSLYGVRRSVTTTGNAGLSPALGWAVTHFVDDSFDDPMLYLNQESDGDLVERVVSDLIFGYLPQRWI